MLALDKDVFDTEDFSLEISRYVTPKEIVESLIKYQSEATLQESAGPRYACALSATTKSRICSVDIYQGPIGKQKKFIEIWEKYRDIVPFKTEIETLEKNGLNPKPEPAKFEYYIKPDFLGGSFDRCFAPEVLLHPAEGFDSLAIPIFDEVYNTLEESGKFMFTVYPPYHSIRDSGCLDRYFEILAKTIRVNAIKDNWINIKKISSKINKKTYEGNKDFFDSFWLRDLSKIRLYPHEEIEELAKDRFRILSRNNIPGGMFPFATRDYYVLEKL